MIVLYIILTILTIPAFVLGVFFAALYPSLSTSLRQWVINAAVWVKGKFTSTPKD